MEDEIEDYTVSEVVGKFKSTIHHELAILKDEENNWVNKSTLYERTQYYEVENLIVTDKVNLAKELFTAINGRSSADTPMGHKWMAYLIETFDIHAGRVETFLKNESELEVKIDPDKIEDFKDSLTFRNKASTNLVKLKKAIKGITVGERELPEVSVRPHAKTPVASLAVRNVLEEKHPDIVEYLEKRKQLTKKKDEK